MLFDSYVPCIIEFPPTFIFPPILVFFAIPIPPFVINEPVLIEEELVVL